MVVMSPGSAQVIQGNALDLPLEDDSVDLIITSHVEKLGRVVSITTDHVRLEVCVSPQGRSVRVWRNNVKLIEGDV